MFTLAIHASQVGSGEGMESYLRNTLQLAILAVICYGMSKQAAVGACLVLHSVSAKALGSEALPLMDRKHSSLNTSLNFDNLR